MILFYGIAIALILGGGVAVFLALRRYGHALAAVAGVVAAAGLVLVWPLPIHGGFMLLGEALYDEWSRERERMDRAREDRTRERYVQRLADRFRGELPIQDRVALRGGWQRVSFAAGRTAWLDTRNGQVWSAWLALGESPSLPALEDAKRRCREHEPRGYWALPTEAEHALMWNAGGADVLPASDAGSVSYVVDETMRMELPTYRLGRSDNARPQASRRFAVQCVARGPGGPARGYVKRDVPLADWNRYQLSKSM